ncbi:MAG TPA: ATP-binding protein [Candidatus Angelobacter sp.]|nr:ATP-binding protein [Candidatus Angelobacter sp.]
MAVKKSMTVETVDRQVAYVKEQKKKSKGLGIVFADAFLRGMRDLGYKNPAWAVAELIDNAIQAAASVISVTILPESDDASARPQMIAIADNGNGMIPEMISYAVRWGGTTREGDRTGFGRYGYGLPSAAVSMAKRYTVFSKTVGNPWHAVTVDIEALGAAANDGIKTEKLLTAQPKSLPDWVVLNDSKLPLSKMESGTVILLEDLDRLRITPAWKKGSTVRAKFMEYLGVIYRHWIPERMIYVDGTAVEVVDPLFLMEHGRFYSETSVHAAPVDARTFEVTAPSGAVGTISIRASHLPPNFQLENPEKYGQLGAATNKRLSIMKEYNGILICREWRHIDLATPTWTKFQNYDANIKIEINFDPALDEYFGLTTAKQQIVISDEMWEKLRHNGKGGGALVDLVKDLRGRFADAQTQLAAGAENKAAEKQPKPSVVAMQESEKFKDFVPPETAEQQAEAAKNLQEEAGNIAGISKQPVQHVVQQLEEKAKVQHWEIQFAAVPEGPFYRPFRLGEQKRVILNTEHPFYIKLYEPAHTDVRSALEVLLFVLAERELESSGDGAVFYKAERGKWSDRLRHALDKLVPDQSMQDKASATAEAMHMVTEITTATM